MNKILLSIVIVLLTSTLCLALRVSKPFMLKYPIDQEQISQLNKYLEELWYMQNGRSEFDIVTTTKSQARNGEIWMIQTGSTVRIQIKTNNTIYTFTPDGY